MIGRGGALLGKDLLVLLRSRALLVLLLLYPLLLAGIVAALTRDAGSRPRVAYVDQDGLAQQLKIGDSTVDYQGLLDDVRKRVDLVPMDEQEAEDALSRGDVVASVTVPSGFVRTLRGMLQSPTITLRTRSGVVGERAIREVQSFVYDLNTALQDEFLRQNVEYLRLLVTGGKAQFLGDEIDILGLDRTAQIVQELRDRATSEEDRAAYDQILGFANDARLALGVADGALEATAHPVALRQERQGGRAGLLENRAIAIVLGVGVALAGVLLGSGAIAAERDEGTLSRLIHGGIGMTLLLVQKVALAAVVGVVLGTVVEVVYAAATSVADVGPSQPWARLPLVVLLLLVGAAAVGAAGVLAGVLARDVAAAALLALLVTLPFLLAGLIPGDVSPILDALGAVFPFDPMVDALAGVLYDPSPWEALGRGLVHLAILAVAYVVVARVAARRLTA
jgi:ABC-2 type transport system permease protein